MRRGDIWLAALDPKVGVEIQKTRPCLVVSPPEIHDHLRIVLVIPMTTGGRPAPFRPPVRFQRKSGLIHTEQMRAIDRARLVRRLGACEPETLRSVLAVLRNLFAE